MGFRTTYRQSLRRRPNAKFRRGPYKSYTRRPGRAVISQGGVGGGSNTMTSGVPPPPELKTWDIPITFSSGVLAGDWAVISPSSILSGIIQGNGPSARIGRKIRVVGVVIRSEITTSVASGGPAPWTMDILWDKQPNGVQALNGQIYTSNVSEALPNANYLQRFQFVKRLHMPAGQTNDTSQIDCTLKCNKLISFDGTTGNVSDVEQNQLLITASCVGTGPFTSNGIIRVIFVDA